MFVRFSYNLHFALHPTFSVTCSWISNGEYDIIVFVYLCCAKNPPFYPILCNNCHCLRKRKRRREDFFQFAECLVSSAQFTSKSSFVSPGHSETFPLAGKPTSLGKNLQRDFPRRKQAGNLRNYVFYFLTISDVATRATLVVQCG